MKGQIAGVQKANSCYGNMFTAVMKRGKALQSEVNKPDSKSSLWKSWLVGLHQNVIWEMYDRHGWNNFCLRKAGGRDWFNLLRSREETLNIDTLGTGYGLNNSESQRQTMCSGNTHKALFKSSYVT